MTFDLRGLLAPLTTPFAPNGELDRAAFEHNIRSHLQHGLDGVVVTGSTGEAPLLDDQERASLVEWARPLLTEGRLLLAGVGAESTRTTVRHAKSAASRGADAVLVVAPHYFGNAMTEAALRAHYLHVAEESPLPVVLYNIPKYMHYRIPAALVAELAGHGNIVGIKDSTGDRDLFQAYLQAQSDDFSVLTGNGTFVKSAFEMGARGGIIAAALFAPALVLGVAEAVRTGQLDTAEVLQSTLTPLAKIIVGDLGPAGIKAAMDAVGLRGGAPRAPLQPVTRAERERIQQLLKDAELPVAA